MLCPIAGYKIDEENARLVAAFVVVGLILAWIAPEVWSELVVFFLGVDFAARAASRPSWSPLARISRYVLRIADRSPRLVDAGPKRFAARIGLGFVLALLAAKFTGSQGVFFALSSILGVCAALEAGFGFCVGCRIHSALYVAAGAFARQNREYRSSGY